MKKISLLLCFIGMISLCAYAQTDNVRIEKSAYEVMDGVTGTSMLRVPAQTTVDIPYAPETESVLLQNDGFTRDRSVRKRNLRPGESLIFSVENNVLMEDSSHFETLSAAIESAIARVPAWMRYDLRFKFLEISNTTVRNRMVNLINSTPTQYLDEVAFVLTYLPVEVLNASRFANDWEHLVHNAELIYQHADAGVIMARAREHGMRTLRQDADEKVRLGITTIEEANRSVADM